MSDIFNTFGQLAAAGGGVAVGPAYNQGRGHYQIGWAVWRVVNGRVVDTDTRPDRPWYNYGRRVFLYLNRAEKQAALAQAQAWAEAQGWHTGPWVRNRMGDYLSADIHKRFPLPKQTRAPKAVAP